MAPPGGGSGGGGGGINPDIIRSLTELLGSSNTNLERMLENLGRLGAGSQSLTGLAGSAQALADHLGGLGRSLTDLQGLLGKVNDQSKKQSSVLKMLGSAWKTFGAAVKGAMNILSGLTDVISTVGGALWDLGAAIIAVPFEMMNWLIKKAKQVIGSGTEIATAYEKIREQFGDLTKSTSKDVIDFGKSMATGMITPTLSARRVFGSMSEALKEGLEVAAAAPATFQLLSDQFEENGLQIMAMAKGLGIGKEELTALQQRAVATGTSLVDLESEITKYAKGMSAQFGLNSKAMSRDMGRAMKDVKHFANSTIKEIAQATTYAHKLGLELKDITGVLDKFNTFDEAAENVSKLSQAFGINVDAMKLVEAKSPADALDMIKQAMNAAGKSADQMNRQELQLLASTVGMSEEQVRMAFSMKNSGVSMDKVKQAGTGLEHQMMNTAEAVAAVADDIERLVKQGQKIEGESFFEIFAEGFLQGIDTSQTFLSLLRDVMKDMHIVRDAGRQLGRAFIENFPGVRDFFEGLRQILNPTAIKGLMSNVVNIFKDFFDQLKAGTADTGKLFDSLVNGFTNFAEKTSGGSQMLKGLKNIWKAVEKIISTGIDWLADKLKSGLEFVVRLLSGDFNKFTSGMPGAIGDAIGGGATAAANSPIAKSFISMFEKLSPQLEKIFDLLWQKIVDKLGKILWEYKWEIALVAFGPSVMKMFISGIGGALSNPAVLSQLASLGPMIANPVTLAIGAAVGSIVAALYQAKQLMDELEEMEKNRKEFNVEAVAGAKEANKNFLTQNDTLKEQIKLLEEKARAGDEIAAAEAKRLKKEQAAGEEQRASGLGRTLGQMLEKGRDEIVYDYLDIDEKKLTEQADLAIQQLNENITSGVKGAGEASIKELDYQLSQLQKVSGSEWKLDGTAMDEDVKKLIDAMKSGEADLEAISKASVDALEKSDSWAQRGSGPNDGNPLLTKYAKGIDMSSEQAYYVKVLAAKLIAEKKLVDQKAEEAALAASAKPDPAEEARRRAAAAELAEKQQEQIAAERASALESLGLGQNLDVTNAKEAIKKVEDLVKDLDEGLLDRVTAAIKKVRDKFDKADFRIFSDTKKSEEVTKTAIDLKMVNTVFVSLADAADNMSNIPAAATKLAKLPEQSAQYSTAITTIKNALFDRRTGVVASVKSLADSYNQNQGDLSAAKNSTEQLARKIEDIVGGITRVTEKLPDLNRGAASLPSAFVSIHKIAKSSDALEGGYKSADEVYNKVADALEASTQTAYGIADFMAPLTTASEGLSKNLTSKTLKSIENSSNNIDQLFTSLAKITTSIAKPIGASSPEELKSKVKAMVDAINQLNDAMTDVKIGENGEVSVKARDLAKGINKFDHKYTIEKKNAVINLTVSVSMSVTDVESMLIKNPNSLIRARINDALGPQKLAVDSSGAGTTAVGAG